MRGIPTVSDFLVTLQPKSDVPWQCTLLTDPMVKLGTLAYFSFLTHYIQLRKSPGAQKLDSFQESLFSLAK